MSNFLPESFAPDPVMFALNWSLTFEILFLIIILSFLVERALALLFESDWFLTIHKKRKSAGKGSFKPLLAVIVAFVICSLWHVDILAIVMVQSHTSLLGELITATLIAGGSKASIALFRDLLEVHSTAWKDYQDSKPKVTPISQGDEGE